LHGHTVGPFALSLSNGELQYRRRSWFDQLTTNGGLDVVAIHKTAPREEEM